MALAKLKNDNAPYETAAQAKWIPTDEPGLVETPTSKKIYRACAHAHETPALVLIFGAAGVSKTTTALQYEQNEGPNAYLVNLHGIKTTTSMLEVIAERLNPDFVGARQVVPLMRATANLLKAQVRAGNKSLLILDECQSLDPDALDMVRLFLDIGVGLVLMGNELVFSTIAGKNRRAMFAQLHSRVGMKLHLPHPTEADADAVLKSFGVSEGTAREYGCQLALGPLALRGLVTVLRQARIVATAKNMALDHQVMYATSKALGLDA